MLDMVCWCYLWNPLNPGAGFDLKKFFSRLLVLLYLQFVGDLEDGWDSGKIIFKYLK